MQMKDLALLGIEPSALTDEIGEEDAVKLDHTVGLNKLLEDLEKIDKSVRDRIKLASLVIEMALRNVYGCPMPVCYWMIKSPFLIYIKMTNPSLQLVSLITIDVKANIIHLQRQISNHIYGNKQVAGIEKLTAVANDGLEWAGIAPNPSTPLFINKPYNVCVYINGDESLKTFNSKGETSTHIGGLIPAWARELLESWNSTKANATYINYKADNVLFSRLIPKQVKVSGVYVLDTEKTAVLKPPVKAKVKG